MLKVLFKQNLLLLLVVLTTTSLFCQNSQLAYATHLNIQNGLAHNGVTCILEDSKGYLWFGTYDGLNKYDGYELKTYKNTTKNTILASNRIRTLSEDKKGTIWIGTDNGISLYDYTTEKFRSVYTSTSKSSDTTSSGPVVRKILFDEATNQTICLTENDGLIIFDKDLKLQIHPLAGDKRNFFNNIIQLDTKHYILSSNKGIFLFNLDNKKVTKVLKAAIPSINAANCGLFKFKNNKLFITLNDGIGVVEYSLKDDKDSFTLVKTFLKGNRFNTIEIDDQNNLWAGTVKNGVYKIKDVHSTVKEADIVYDYFKYDRSLTQCSAILASATSGCWLATYNKGVFQFDTKENPFKSYNIRKNDPNGIQSNHIINISSFDAESVYLTASYGGVGLFNLKTNKFEPKNFTIESDIERSIGALFVDSRKDIWLQINNQGFGRIQSGTNTLEKVFVPNVISDLFNEARSITEDKNGNIWIGTLTDVYKISINEENQIEHVASLNTLHPFFKNKKGSLFRKIYVDPTYGFIWLGTDTDGLFRLSINGTTDRLDKMEVTQYVKNETNTNAISSNFVSDIMRLKNDELWIGTEGGGLCKVLHSTTTPKFVTIAEQDGLSNNVVKSIAADNENRLWVSTNIGLNCIDTKTMTIRTIGMENGLPFEDFYYASIFHKNETMVFSGLDGFCYFNPQEVSWETTPPKLVIEDLKIFNKKIVSGDTINERILLSSKLAQTRKIDLKYNENVFSIALTSLHYSNPETHRIKYKLVPLNEHWIEVPSDQRVLQFSGLQPGDYELYMTASDASGNWIVPKELKIHITPPAWKTTWAYLLYFLALVLAVYIIVRVIFKIQSLNHNLELEKLEIDKVTDINKAKLRFFSNISHEIKTPLTLISGPIEILQNRFKGASSIKNHLNLVHRQTKKIARLVDQVEDFQKADANLLKMHYSKFYFDEFIEEISRDFEFMAQNEQKTLQINSVDRKVFVSADKDKLEKIINNLLSNSFKFTKVGDTIVFKYDVEENNLIIRVQDTGRGVHSDDLSHIFERFYRSQNKHDSYIGGSGIGLAISKKLVEMHYGDINAESEVNMGTTITVNLPIITDAHKNFQMKEAAILIEENSDWHNNSLIEYAPVLDITVAKEFSNALVFLAEDNTEMRKFISSILSNYYNVKTFENGKACLEALETEWPDLIISDLLMPELNGLDLCKRVKSDIKTSHIPIILLTALTAINHQIQGIVEGADSYIKKPFDIKHLVKRVESLLLNRKQLRERYQINLPLEFKTTNTTNQDSKFLSKLYRLFEENVDNKSLDLDTIAKELYLNRTDFYKKVKILTNQTPFELLKEYRLKKAADLLSVKKLPVNEVVEMTGFKSGSNFSKLFKKKFGVTPGKYATQKSNDRSIK